MTLPKPLIDKVQKGKAILFLGSGALVGANLPGKGIPLGNDLRDILDSEFLDSEFSNENLAHVADLSIAATSIFELQDFVKDYFADLEPADFHLQIPNFHWKAIFTTNYDRLVEVCYEKNEDKLQKCHLILSNNDNFDEARSTNDIVPYIKLHGCVTRTHDEDLPLILTVDQYNDSMLKHRKRLFSNLYELAYEYAIIFVGHSLQDPNIRKVLKDLQREVPSGQRHYLLKPGAKQPEIDLWGGRKISVLDVTFENFINSLNNQIDQSTRALSLILPPKTHPIQSTFSVKSPPSENMLRTLSDGAEYISDQLTYLKYEVKDFFRGADTGWFSTAEDLCVERTLTRKLCDLVVEKSEEDRRGGTELVVVKGEAGSGKTILLRQMGWKYRASEVGVFLWVKSGQYIDIEFIQEVSSKSQERIFLLWDDAARNFQDIARVFHSARKHNVPLTIITAERFGEWNNYCSDLDSVASSIHRLPYLGEREIECLLRVLEKNDCLGPNLTPKTHEERKREFEEVYGRQLLVALYEATMGEPIEDIIFDEYQKISPQDAKDIYRTVCTLNRLRVPVRAGLISRIYEISFTDFQQRFFAPLERIVLTTNSDSYGGDIHYSARHSEIADIVFKRALVDPVDRYNEYIRVLGKLNVSFESDRMSFRSMIKARNLLEIFPAYQDIVNIYQQALESVGEDPYLLQQMANFERLRDSGNLAKAVVLLNQARELAPNDSSLLHSSAVLWRERAHRSKDIPARVKYRGEARSILQAIVRRWGDGEHIANELVLLELDGFEEILINDKSTEKTIDTAARGVEKLIVEVRRKYPGDSRFLELEAKFAQLINDSERAKRALERSFTEDNRDPYTASRLAKIYKKSGDFPTAIRVIRSALERRNTDHRLNFQLAELLRKSGSSDFSELTYYYRRGFTPGDKNYQAQFWYGRFTYESTDPKEAIKAKDIFTELRKSRVSYAARIAVQDYIGGSSSPITFHGTAVNKLNGFGFIRVDGRGEELYFSENQLKPEDWELLLPNDRVKLNVGFSFNGPVCCNVKLV